MRLITKTLLYYLLACFPLLALAGYFSYRLILMELNEGVDEALLKAKIHIEKTAKLVAEPLKVNLNELDQLTLAAPDKKETFFADTVIFDSLENENVKYRVITGYFLSKGQNYRVQLVKETIEEEELLECLLTTFLIIGAFLLFVFFMLSWFLSKTLWRPFYRSLEKLNQFELNNQLAQNFDAADTAEFHQLNTALNKVTAKMHEDFSQQKEFTENASHEMQTPLAIIKANVSLLIQSPNLMSDEMQLVQTIDDTAKKLSALNRALLTLTKIENRQFTGLHAVDLRSALDDSLLHFNDFIVAKNIEVKIASPTPLQVKINKDLMIILVNNLIQNAIKHNFSGGCIDVLILNNTLTVTNSGPENSLTETEVFVRFKKHTNSKDSLGLGLAIVKSICKVYNVQINYAYALKMHRFELKFKI